LNLFAYHAVTTAACLRPAASAPALRLFLSPTAFPSSIQSRRQVTKVKPAKQKPVKIKPDTSAVPLNKIDQIDWSKIDLSEISRPPPSNPEPKLHYEDGKTYFKHPLRYAFHYSNPVGKSTYIHYIQIFSSVIRYCYSSTSMRWISTLWSTSARH
jgi:hypothetical protein